MLHGKVLWIGKRLWKYRVQATPVVLMEKKEMGKGKDPSYLAVLNMRVLLWKAVCIESSIEVP